MRLRSYSFHNSAILSSTALISIGLFSANAQAIAPPADFDSWTADSSHNITATCPVGYFCLIEINERGFLQEQLYEANPDGTPNRSGSRFYRTIISEDGYRNAALVKITNQASSLLMRHGIATTQSVSKSQTTLNADTNFSSDTSIYTGWASDMSVNNLQIDQSINEISRKAASSGKRITGSAGYYLEGNFNASTNIRANYDENGTRTGYAFTADQAFDEPGQYEGLRYGTYKEIDSQVFSIRGLEGDLLTTAGSLTLDGNALSWAEGDKLWGIAMGQNFHHSDQTGTRSTLEFGTVFTGSQALGVMFESYDNRSDNVGAVNYFAYFENNTNAWPTVFGAAPMLPAPTGNSGSTVLLGGSPGAGPAPTLVAGLFTPTAVGPAQANGRDAPLVFGQWSVVGGTLTAEGVLADPIDLVGDGLSPPTLFTQGGDGSVMPECSTEVTCTIDDVTAPGMIQRIVTDAEGRRYIQTILTDLDTGFSSESFVSMADTALLGGGTSYVGGTVDGTKESGIAYKMVLSEDRNEVDAVGHIATNVGINTGWAARTGTPNVAISQDITEAGRASSTFDEHFLYQGNLDAAGNTIGSLVDVDLKTAKSAVAYNGAASNIVETLDFAHRSRAGNLQLDSAGTGSLGRATGSLDWAAGDAITATWVYTASNQGQHQIGSGIFYDNLVDNLGLIDSYSAFYANETDGLSKWVSSAFGDAPVPQ